MTIFIEENVDDIIILWDCCNEIIRKLPSDESSPSFMPDADGYGAQRQFIIEHHDAIVAAIIQWAGDRYEDDPFDMELAPEFMQLWHEGKVELKL